ncbi:MAG TPA: hypothetical protein VGM27_19050 [Acidobacteriaceae bacterium]
MNIDCTPTGIRCDALRLMGIWSVEAENAIARLLEITPLALWNATRFVARVVLCAGAG